MTGAGLAAVSVDGAGSALYYGSDGTVHQDRPFTPAERREIADYQAQLWLEWVEGGDK